MMGCPARGSGVIDANLGRIPVNIHWNNVDLRDIDSFSVFYTKLARQVNSLE